MWSRLLQIAIAFLNRTSEMGPAATEAQGTFLESFDRYDFIYISLKRAF